MIAVLPGKIIKQPTVVAPISPVMDFVDAYYRSDNISVSGNVATSLNAVKGSINIPYVGLSSPTLARPFLINGEIAFLNQPNANFKALVRNDGNPYPLPEEITIVFRKMPGIDYEALLSGWGNYYVGFGTTLQLRSLNSDTYYSTPISMPYFALNYLHLRYEGGTTGISKAWLNGVYVGQVTAGTWVRRQGYGVGIETNSTDYNWHASMFIERGMTDAERLQYFSAIEDEFAIGSLPTVPYASSVVKSLSGGNLVANYQYNGSLPQNIAATEYQWWKVNPDLSKQTLISTDASIANQSGVKCCVKVADVEGNSFMYISGQY